MACSRRSPAMRSRLPSARTRQGVNSPSRSVHTMSPSVWIVTTLPTVRLQPGNLTVQVPASLLEILHLRLRGALGAGTPDVLDGVAPVEVDVLSDLDALDAGNPL